MGDILHQAPSATNPLLPTSRSASLLPTSRSASLLPTSYSLLPSFTRTRLRDLAECPRRFWLRNIAQVPWPAAPLPPAVEESLEHGREFHQLMERHFLGLELENVSPELRAWWTAWQRHPFPLPPGRRLPEITLSVPLDGERLLARFDLLALAKDGQALILDWKTERHPRTRAQLATDIQTQLYPYVLAEGSAALTKEPAIAPDQIEMIYWQANDPTNPARFAYTAEQHAANRSRFQTLIAQASTLRPDVEPPSIDDPTLCARCAYRTYCGREIPPKPNPYPEDDNIQLEMGPIK